MATSVALVSNYIHSTVVGFKGHLCLRTKCTCHAHAMHPSLVVITCLLLICTHMHADYVLNQGRYEGAALAL